jgi:hypothetical protein
MGRKAMLSGNGFIILMVILVSGSVLGLVGLAMYCLNKTVDQSEG